MKQQKLLNATQIPKYDCRPRTAAKPSTNHFSNNIQVNSVEKGGNQSLLMSPMMVQKNVAVAPYFRSKEFVRIMGLEFFQTLIAC